VTAHTRVATRIHASLQQVGVAIAPTLINDALADVPTFELAAVLAERWATSPSQHAFIRMPAGEVEAATSGPFLLAERVEGFNGLRFELDRLFTYTTVERAKRGAMGRNRKRLDPGRWWVVVDAAGVPLDPQP